MGRQDRGGGRGGGSRVPVHALAAGAQPSARLLLCSPPIPLLGVSIGIQNDRTPPADGQQPPMGPSCTLKRDAEGGVS